jgi:hypothetical protein
MNIRRTLLFAYRQVLRFYPAEFRDRFSEEMMEIAGAAELAEWPLIFGDTSVTIMCSWMRQSALRPVAVGAAAGQYLSLGKSPVNPAKLLQGLGIATIVVLLACCLSRITVWHFPTDCDYAQCRAASAEVVRR